MTTPARDRTKTALYVDFDNIFLNLAGEDRRAAQEFATAPQRWLRWIEEGMNENADGSESSPVRNVLVRRCYLNPQSFGNYRPYFTRSGFSVIDCPPLTTRGKNSADIVMVMDIIDALEHQTRFDEFVIMSGDADFTPVLHRLRMHDRRTTVLASGSGAAAAYKAACDHLIREDVFIEAGLRIGESSSSLLGAIADRLYAVVSASDDGAFPVAQLPQMLRRFPEFTVESNWLGFYSMRALVQALLERRPELRYEEGEVHRIVLSSPSPRNGQGPDAAAPPADSLRAAALERLRALVASSAEPVSLPRAAQELRSALGETVLATDWFGAGSFTAFLATFSELGFAVATTPPPGRLYDPERHSVSGSSPLIALPSEMVALIRRINQVIDAPRLTPSQYRLVFEQIVEAVRESEYNLISTGRTVRDRCAERGAQISRQAINGVLRGLRYAGAFRTDTEYTADELARTYRDNMLKQLRTAGVALDGEELSLLDAWLSLGEAPAEPASAGEPPAATHEAAIAEPADEMARDAPPSGEIAIGASSE
jgi:NYN domain